MEAEVLDNNKALVPNGLTADIGPLATASSVGWQLPLDLNLTEWREKADFVGVLSEARQFVIGDLMIAGRAKVKDRRYDYLEAMGVSADFANRCEWVCGKIPAEYRLRKPVTFEHHATVANVKMHCAVHNADPADDCGDCEAARLDEIAFWLGKVEKSNGKMTVIDLKTAMQEHYASRDSAPKAKPKKISKRKAAAESGDLDEGEAAQLEPEIWDPERLESAAKACKDQVLKNLKPRLANLVTKKGRPDRRRIEAALKAAEDVRGAVKELIMAGGEALDSLDALAK